MICYHCLPGYTRGPHSALTCTCPLVCICAIARPEPSGQCETCWRPVVALWPAGRYRTALAAYPQLTEQTIDWTLRGKAMA